MNIIICISDEEAEPQSNLTKATQVVNGKTRKWTMKSGSNTKSVNNYALLFLIKLNDLSIIGTF